MERRRAWWAVEVYEGGFLGLMEVVMWVPFSRDGFL